MQTSFIPNPTLRGSDPVDVLRLIRSEQVGPMTFFQLVKFCGSVKKALEMAPGISQRGGRKKPIVITPRAVAEREYDALTKYGATLVMYGEESYPRLLASIADAPPILTVRGHAHLLKEKNLIGMVGARNASANGCAFARKLAGDLGNAKFTVVSGLARGIDTAAHRGSLATGTIAVIGGGIDNIYPTENAALYEEIAAVGCIVSELPFGMAPHAKSFPARNRIIAGMSRGVAVIEASLKSGSLITADYANDYGRDVFAVPGSPMDPRCNGSNSLLKQGAVLLESVHDITGNLPPMRDLPLAEAEAPMFAEPGFATISDDLLSEARAAILAALSFSPTLLDDVLAASGTSPHLLMAVLLELELAGRLERHSGARVSLKATECL
jgi:DNA processing protein